jgi:large-conductance mechanosensitive channel
MMSVFRDFAVRGNVVDMAVGIVIGAPPKPSAEETLLTEIRDLIRKE